jgi:hypothetical protein
LIDRQDFITKTYVGKDKKRIQKWYMHYCDLCKDKRSYAPAIRSQYCKSCSCKIKFANKNKQDIDTYLSLNEARKLNDKLATRLRNRINRAIECDLKSGSAVSDLGCSIEEFKVYLESKWQEGMTWENHAVDGWHIDHIIPLSYFDLTNREQFLKACHYTNMQPMWAKDNLSKGNKECG